MSTNTVDMAERSWERLVREAVEGLRYGSVQIVVHDGRVVQVETRQTVRLPDPRRPDHRRRLDENAARADRKTGGSAPYSNEGTP